MTPTSLEVEVNLEVFYFVTSSYNAVAASAVIAQREYIIFFPVSSG